MGQGLPAGLDSPVYPLSLRLQGRRVLVAGGGSVAARRVAGLRAAGADVCVVAPRLSPTLADLSSRGLITAHQREYVSSDTDGAWLVLACTDRPEVNAAVAADAHRQRIWCVRADDAAESAAWVPAVGRPAGATVAVNAGRDPRRAALLRDRCVAAVEDAARSPLADRGRAPSTGTVSIVGGGPGGPGLITLTGLQRLRGADVVVADRLAPLELLEELPPDVRVIDAAKVPGGPAMRQEQINQALVEHARAGHAVVRLKGGDPFVFGRGREEVEACLAGGVPVEVVPGVTSAISVPAAAGIPVTHRGLSRGFCVVAGHASATDPASAPDWGALARSGLTLILLMGIEHLAATAGTLLAAGLAPGTPCACIADGWTLRQRVVTASLAELAAAVKDSGIANPAVIVIGDVARFARDPAALPPAPAPGHGQAPGAPGPAATPASTAPASTAPASTAPANTAPASTAPASTAPASTAPASTAPASTAPASTAPASPAPASTAPASTAPAPGGGAPTAASAHGRRVLVLGGARSGKSAAAESMLAGCEAVDYIATGAPHGCGDEEWDTKVTEHQRRRPAHWRTVETLSLPDVLAVPGSQPPVLVECLTTWLARVMDECGIWEGRLGCDGALAGRIGVLERTWRDTHRHVVAVSNEIGSGVVPGTASGRRFRDELGALNARIAAASDEVWLCTAGIARRLR